MPRPLSSGILLSLSLLAAIPAQAQIGVPALPGALRPELPSAPGDPLDTLGERLQDGADILGQTARRGTQRLRDSLEQQRRARLDALLRQNRARLEPDADGNPARKGEILLIAPDAATLAKAATLGFAVAGEERLDALGLAVTRLALPPGLSLARAQALLRKALPDATLAPDSLHFAATASAPASSPAAPGWSLPPVDVAVGVIDGAPGAAAGTQAVAGFAPGAPLPGDHGSAMVWLLHRAGVRRVLVADVFGQWLSGTGPAGGDALAIARGLDWLIGRGVRVVSISLVGPANALVAQALNAARQRGAVIVAAVGNDGPGAPPAYPASYPGVIAVTGVDRRNRALIEAGHALHLDYAAPGADMRAMDARGRLVGVRGTSYATPLVAARAATAMASRGATASIVIAALDREAIDLPPRGADAAFGRGLICTICR